MFEATLRYNSNSDKQSINTSLEYIDSLIIPGRMIAANSKAIPSNLKNYRDEADVGYYIEPSVADFRVGDDFTDDAGRVRTWHSKYIQQVDERLADLLEERENIDPADLLEEDVRRITSSSVEFQEKFVPGRIQEEAGKYDTIENVESYQPEAVIPWYNKIRREADFEVGDTIIDEAKDAAELPVKPCLFVTKSLIRDQQRSEQLVELLTSNGIDQCFLWVENLDKQATGQGEYEDLAQLVVNLADEEISAHFFYGDYFATLLSHLGLEGTVYGSMYGEEETEQREQRSGQGVITRYYTDAVKDFLKIPAAVDLQQRTDAMMCFCDVCDRQFDSWQDLAEMEQDDDENIQAPMKKHHIRVRWDQIRRVESESLEDTIDRIESDYQDYVSEFFRSNQIADSKSLDYIPRWVNAVESVTDTDHERAEK
ncbi:hypothetical protein SAMN05216226_104241 [Halovenus aranensis]|uniref:Uncharacterized protein n=1 Tax=Halovenus aranensis TaxID=890420 RepID=A0A1G8UG70_9EURY|nr:hypothetical protein [Halovenus aranensis]SDJ52721.1 hypothetical protein SAMN05216226_104241 [Halovenus aranensis]